MGMLEKGIKARPEKNIEKRELPTLRFQVKREYVDFNVAWKSGRDVIIILAEGMAREKIIYHMLCGRGALNC